MLTNKISFCFSWKKCKKLLAKAKPEQRCQFVEQLIEMFIQMCDGQAILVYIDDLLAHSKTYAEHLILLDHVFTRVKQHNLKVNLAKCFLGCKIVAYLRIQLTEESIKCGSDKLKVVAAAKPPINVHKI